MLDEDPGSDGDEDEAAEDFGLLADTRTETAASEPPSRPAREASAVQMNTIAVHIPIFRNGSFTRASDIPTATASMLVAMDSNTSCLGLSSDDLLTDSSSLEQPSTIIFTPI